MKTISFLSKCVRACNFVQVRVLKKHWLLNFTKTNFTSLSVIEPLKGKECKLLMGLSLLGSKTSVRLKRFIEFVIVASWHWTRTSNLQFVQLNEIIENLQWYLGYFRSKMMWVDIPFLATIPKPLFALRLFYCCVSSVKKYSLGTLKCHDHNNLNTSSANQIAALWAR